MRTRVAGLAALAVVALFASGCDKEASADPGWPPGAAGMACQLLEYDAVAEALGTRFDTAGGAVVEQTYTCALTRSDAEYPDLTLSMTVSSADELIFTASATPSGAAAVPDLGRTAYLARTAPTEAHGAGLEVGWLSVAGRLMVLRYTFQISAEAAEVDRLAPQLVAFAQRLEQTAV